MPDFSKHNDIQNEWNKKGEDYATAINEMVNFGEKYGWENWKGKEVEDKREHLSEEVIKLLKQANEEGTVDEFRNNFPPAHAPFIKYLKEQSQSIEQLCFIDNQKIVFLIGTSYQKRQAYLLNEDKLIKLDPVINAIGKSKTGNVFAIASENKIITTQGWEGNIIKTFELKNIANIGITELIPFNDGLRILLVSSEGIYLISANEEKLLHPVNEDNEEDWEANIDMENATLSFNNEFIVAGDQGSDHIIFDNKGVYLGRIGPQSSYPHYCLFSKDDKQLITNSCHFYNGVTIGVDTSKLKGMEIEPYQESDEYTVIDGGMRVYAGLATSGYYILGDAYGYIRAFDKNGKQIWQHFLGSSISGIAISDDEKTLWVGSYSGMLHKLTLGKGHRDKHTIGTGNHYEEFRIIFWKNEPEPLRW